MTTKMNRAAAAVGGLAIAAACAVGCAGTKEAAKDMASSAASVGSSAASVVSSGASVAGSAVSSGASVASSVVSSVLDRAPETAKDATEATKKSGLKWWWIPIGIALAALLASLLRTLTRRKPEPAKVAVQRAPDVKTTRVVDHDRDRRND